MAPDTAQKKKRTRGKRGADPGGRVRLLDREQQREILAVGLLALSLFSLLSLLPLSVFGPRGPEWFPSGNAMGVVGGTLQGLLVAGIGVGAWGVPLLLTLGGLHLGGWTGPSRSLRLFLLGMGLLVLVPVGANVMAPDPAAGGWLGATLGLPLVGAVGWLGAILVVAVLLVTLSVVSLGWNPLRTVEAGVRRGGGAVGRGLLRAGRASASAKGAWRSRREAAPTSSPADEGPFARESGEEAGETAALATGDGGRARPPASADPVLATEAAVPEAAPESPALSSATSSAPAERPATRVARDLFPDPADPATLRGGSLPPLDLLAMAEGVDRRGMERELDRLGEVLVEKLRTFNVQSELGGRTTGPMVTQFEVVPAPGIKVNRIANLDADLALAMKAQSIRIVAPIPGKGAVGVEIPNPEPQMVYLREILEAKEYQKARGHLPLALGKDLTGRPYVADLAKMPHALIAGATGSGKSVCINTVVTSLVYRHTPETLRLLMIDPKMVELSAYADLPHLRHPVVTDPRDAAGVLKWAVLEMERRYQLLSANGVRSIGEFNQRLKDGATIRRVAADGPEGDPDRWIYTDGVLPFIVVVVDELADLMMTVQSEIERPLAQLAQKARAIGIHLIVATQRPSVNVITGLIKANFPTRIAFRVASKTDSRTILDQNGAEALLGNGDMLFLPPGASEPVRIQGAFISTEDTDAMLDWFRDAPARASEEPAEGATLPLHEPDILEEVRNRELEESGGGVEEISGDWDDLFRAAAEICIQHDQGSTSLLQRRLKVGYGRAARIVDQLHEAGVLGPPDGSKPREVLITLGELDQMLGPGA